MATKTTSRKTTASARSTPKKPNGDSPKPAKAATAAESVKAKSPKAVPAKSAPGEIASRTTKPAETGAKPAPRRLKADGAAAKKAQSEAGVAPLEVVPPAAARPSREEIAARAAALWRQNGGPAFDNWIRAERELGA